MNAVERFVWGGIKAGAALAAAIILAAAFLWLYVTFS